MKKKLYFYSLVVNNLENIYNDLIEFEKNLNIKLESNKIDYFHDTIAEKIILLEKFTNIKFKQYTRIR